MRTKQQIRERLHRLEVQQVDLKEKISHLTWKEEQSDLWSLKESENYYDWVSASDILQAEIKALEWMIFEDN